MTVKTIRNKKNKFFSVYPKPWLWLAVMLIPLFFACLPAPSDTVEISWATNQHFTRFEAVSRFEHENPGIRVNIRPVSEPRQFLLQCLYGDSPDVMTFFQLDAFQSFAGNNLLLPLAVDTYRPWPFYPQLKDYCFRRGDQSLMALPQVAYPYLLFFNPALVSPARARAVGNWSDLLALIERRMPLPPKNGKRVFGLDIHSDVLWFNTWYWQRNGRIFDPHTGQLVLDPTRVADTLSEIRNFGCIFDRSSKEFSARSKPPCFW